MFQEMKKIWIVGSSGHVGTALMKLLNNVHYQLLVTDEKEVDVTERESVAAYMHMTRPDVVINCAGVTDLKMCEENPDQAYRVNAIGARNLAIEAEKMECKLIQISTDDVFGIGNENNITEFDEVHPRSVYGKSKYAGEQLVSQLTNKHVILRSSWIYGTGKDFVDTIVRAIGEKESIEVPTNEFASPTSAKEFAKVIQFFIEKEVYGVYHVVCQGGCSRYEFAHEILKILGKEDELKLIPIEKKQAIHSILDNMMLRLDWIDQPKEWKEALTEYLTETGGDE